jgi:type IV pilus assembly protein PilV
MSRRFLSATGSGQRGITIVEVLVAVVVVSLGMVGILGANTRGFMNVSSAGYRAQASLMASQIIERARANSGGSYAIAYGTSTGGTGQATADLAEWKALLARSIPSGDGQITETIIVDPVTTRNVRAFTVTVQWDDRRATGQTWGTASAGSPEYKYLVTQTYLPAVN